MSSPSRPAAHARLARLILFLAFNCAAFSLLACKTATPPPSPRAEASQYPPRPSIAAPPVKMFHQDNDTLTLTTKPDATDAEISAILWQFRDAAHTHSFAALNLPQAFIDARKPTVWFHVYRGSKCASEKYTKGPLPCDASYHGSGDYTLGAYNNPSWEAGVLPHADGSETNLWNPDKP